MSELRNLVRVLVGTALSTALVACAVLPIPEDLPAVALEQAPLYRLEVALGVFYGCLLIATPAYSGLVRGHLPVEISTRGARFAAEADESVERDATTIKGLEQGLTHLKTEMAATQLEISRLRKIRDRT